MESLAQTSSTKWHNERASLSTALVSRLRYLVNAQKLSTVHRRSTQYRACQSQTC